MTSRPERPAIDYERLAAYLRVLSAPARLELLRKLQVPRAVSEIEVSPYRDDREMSDDRAISRQAVEAHLRKLQESGLVTARVGARDGRSVSEWSVNPARVFVLVDELRRLTLARSLPGSSTDSAGRDAPQQEWPEIPPGPSIIVASGPIEGTAFPLVGEPHWTIGRDRGLTVSLPYDPFVSRENTLITREGGALVVRDHPTSRNGTSVNWRPLKRGESVALASGDTISVGRTLLVARGV